MATTDNNLQVINSMTQEQMQSLKDSSGKIPSLANQLIMTDEEDVNLSQMRSKVLYQNLTLTSFPAQTLSMNLTQFDMFYITFKTRAYSDRNIIKTAIINKNLDDFLYGFDQDGNTKKRPVLATDTGFIFGDSNDGSGGCVPILIIGLSKEPAVIYTGDELYGSDTIKINNGVFETGESVTKTDVLYFRTSSDKNWGYAGGLLGGVSVSGKDFSKYKYLIAYVRVLEVKIQVKIDLNYSEAGYIASGAGVSYLDDAIMSARCTVNDSKNTFTVNSIGFYNTAGWNARNNNSSYFVYKIEGVY